MSDMFIAISLVFIVSALLIGSGLKNSLWLVIFAHGFIDTVGIGLIAMDADKDIQDRIWKTPR